MMHPVIDTIATVLNEVENEKKFTSSSSSSPPSSTPHIAVYSMDGDANFHPNFLTPEENRALPLVKFFPKCGSKLFSEEIRIKKECQPVLYEGRPNVQSILKFIHQHMKEEPQVDVKQPNKILAPSSADVIPPLQHYHEIAQTKESQTREHVVSALIKRFEADAEDMPALKLHEIAPCG